MNFGLKDIIYIIIIVACIILCVMIFRNHESYVGEYEADISKLKDEVIVLKDISNNQDEDYDGIYRKKTEEALQESAYYRSQYYKTLNKLNEISQYLDTVNIDESISILSRNLRREDSLQGQRRGVHQ